MLPKAIIFTLGKKKKETEYSLKKTERGGKTHCLGGCKQTSCSEPSNLSITQLALSVSWLWNKSAWRGVRMRRRKILGKRTCHDPRRVCLIAKTTPNISPHDDGSTRTKASTPCLTLSPISPCLSPSLLPGASPRPAAHSALTSSEASSLGPFPLHCHAVVASLPFDLHTMPSYELQSCSLPCSSSQLP